MFKKEIKPLSLIKTGRTVRLVGVDAGRGLKNRLASMGVLPNVEITVVMKESHLKG